MKKQKFVSWTKLFNSSLKKIIDDDVSIMSFSRSVEVLMADGTKIVGYIESNAPSYEDTYILTYEKKPRTPEMTVKELIDIVTGKERTKISELPKNTKFNLLG
jgi:hypothetical protein